MEILKDYHHYKKELVDEKDRVAKCEIYVSEFLLNLEVKEEERESSTIFELKHHHSTAQFAKILARKRNLPIDICTIGALLHDIYVIKTGKYKDHAHKGAEIAKEILDQIGFFTEVEKEQIYKIVYNHSDKNIWSNDPFEEFGKDVDVLDCFLYTNGFGYYLKNKPLNIFYQYTIRAKKVWEELNLPEEKEFNVLENYNENWFNYSVEITERDLIKVLNNETAPTFCFYKTNDNYKIFTNKINWCKMKEKASITDNYEQLLELSEIPSNIILVWKAIESYEILNKDNSKNRIKELGIKQEV